MHLCDKIIIRNIAYELTANSIGRTPLTNMSHPWGLPVRPFGLVVEAKFSFDIVKVLMLRF